MPRRYPAEVRHQVIELARSGSPSNPAWLTIDSTTRIGDKAATTLRWAGLLFLIGLLAVGAALGILILKVTF
jgi:hypothetical protein